MTRDPELVRNALKVLGHPAQREALRRWLAEGEGLKRAAWRAGMAVRTARRHRREWQ